MQIFLYFAIIVLMGILTIFFAGLLDFIKQQHSAVIFNNVASWAKLFIPYLRNRAAKSNLFLQAH